MVFGGIVSLVGGTGFPVEVELLGFDAVNEPMMAHVERFWAFEANVSVEDAEGGRVIGFERSAGRWLRMTHLCQRSDDRNSFLGVEKKGTGLGFGGGSSNGADCFAKDMDSGVGGREGRSTDSGRESGQKKMAGGSTASIG